MRWDSDTVKVNLSENKNLTPTQFRTSYPGLVAWCNRNGGWDKWMAEYGIKKRGWDNNSALEMLQKHKDKNYTWFLANYNSLVLWCRSNGGWRKWANKVGIIPRKVRWNATKVTQTFMKYNDKPMQWFYDNYGSMIQWCIKNGGIIQWKQRVKKKDIVRASKRTFNNETITEILNKYKKEGKTAQQIRSCDSSVSTWCERNGGWDKWTKDIGIDQRVYWDEEKVLEVLRANKDKIFDWFKFHYKTLTSWCSSHGGWFIFAQEAGLHSNQIRSHETVVAFFKKHKRKELMWFIKNHPNLVRWCYRNYEPASDGLRYFASLGGVDVGKEAA